MKYHAEVLLEIPIYQQNGLFAAGNKCRVEYQPSGVGSLAYRLQRHTDCRIQNNQQELSMVRPRI